MIEFATLLLGLITGPRQVELAAIESVAEIEISLDGRVVGRLERSPWLLEVDFGERLQPHRLTAIAYDASQREIGVAMQIVNYSRSSFEAAIVLEPSAAGQAARGRVVWQGALKLPPRRIDLHLDFQPLEVDEAGGFVLPPYDSDRVHVLETTVTFADGSLGLTGLTLGGDITERTTTALTAVPLISPETGSWSRTAVEGWLAARGLPLAVFSTSAGDGRLVVLRDHQLDRATQKTIPGRQYILRSRNISAAAIDYQVMAIASRPIENHPGTFGRTRPAAVDPRYGLRQLLVLDRPLVPEKRKFKETKGPQKLWDSLAVAGLTAARTNAPRAVLLMLGRHLVDGSRFTAHQVLDYLASIHVPLLVWAPDRQALEAFGLGHLARSYLGPNGILELELVVEQTLAAQTIVWVEGEYLPTEIDLTDRAAADVALVR